MWFFWLSRMHLLAVINVSHRNLRFTFRFVLVKFRKDTIVQPIETEWFQFYTPNQDQVIQPLAESAVAVSVFYKHFVAFIASA